MRTAFFVDGYNVFYGLLTDTPYKWLNLPNVAVHYGRHQLEPARAPRFISKKIRASRQDTTPIWKLEEKETDVHIAISMYRTAARQTKVPATESIQQLVLVSGDTDMAPALKAIREDFPQITVGIVLPYRSGFKRTPPGSLKEHSHWMRKAISTEELQSHQFPDRVPTRKTPAIKPDYW